MLLLYGDIMLKFIYVSFLYMLQKMPKMAVAETEGTIIFRYQFVVSDFHIEITSDIR